MKKEAINPGAIYGEVVETLANMLRTPPTPPPAPTTTSNDKNTNPTSGDSLLINNKTAEENGLSFMGEAFENAKPLNKEKKPITKKEKPAVDPNWRKNMNSMHTPVDEPKNFKQEVLERLKINPKKHMPVKNLQKNHKPFMDLSKAKHNKLLAHLTKHKLPYGVAAIGLGALGTKAVFDHLNKEEQTDSHAKV